MKRTFLIGTLLLISAIAFSVPTEITFQGRLTDDLGVPIEGTDDITFEIYSAESGGTMLWSETQSVFFRNGLYHVSLGEITPLTEEIFDGSTVYIQLRIGGEPVSPRQPMVTVPYAFRAEALDTFWLNDYIEDHAGSITHIDSIDIIDSVAFISHIVEIDSISFVEYITSIDSIGFIEFITSIDSIAFIDYISTIDSLVYAEYISRIDSIGYIDSIGWIGHVEWASHVHWDSIVGIPADLGGFQRLRADAYSWLSDSVTFVSGTNVTLTQTGDSIIIASIGGSGGDSDWEIRGDDMNAVPAGQVTIGTTSPAANTKLTVEAESGTATKAIIGRHPSGAEGWLGTDIYGAYGQFNSFNYGYLGASGYGVYATGESHAGYFDGAVTVSDGNALNVDIISAEGGTDNIDMGSNLDLNGHYLNNSDGSYMGGDVVINDDIVPNDPAQDLGKSGYEWDQLYLSGGINLPSTGFINIDGDMGSDDVLMADPSGHLYWADGSGSGGGGVSSLNSLTGDLNIYGEGGLDVSTSGTNIYLNMTVDPGDCPTVVDMTGGSLSNQFVACNLQTTTQSIAQFLIPATEIGCTGGRIYSMTLTATATSGTVSDVDVWLDNVLIGDLAAGTVFPVGSPILDGTTITINVDHTVELVFPRGFRYDGDNILVTMRKNSTDGAFTSWQGHSTAEVNARYNATSADFPLVTTANFRPDVILDFLAPELPDIVNSVNGISGPVTLAEGTNITLSESGSTITINASGGGSSIWTDGGTYIQPSTAPTFTIEDDGDLDMGGRNIENVYEFSANSIDPVLKINDKLFRTWTLDMVGQRTEVVGTAEIGPDGTWEIDIANQKEATDLWLFQKAVVDESIIPFVTPHSPANLYAKMEGTRFIVGNADHAANSPKVTFSYRLIGVRYDFRDMSQEETNIRLKPSDMYIDIDSGARYRNEE